jgi:hypothetical protein
MKRINKGCTGKIAYRSMKNAMKDSKKMLIKKGIQLYAYDCIICGKWHNSKMSPSEYLKKNRHITK